MKTPTVRYGTSGAASNGRKPTPMTITLRVMARAGSPNIGPEAAAQDPCFSTISRVREMKWIA